MTETITLPVDLARKLAYTSVGKSHAGWTITANEHVERGRGEELRDLVIRRDSDGQHYLGSYQRGLTESQHTRPWEDEAEAEFAPVVPVTRTITDYVTPEAAQALAEQQDGAR